MEVLAGFTQAIDRLCEILERGFVISDRNMPGVVWEIKLAPADEDDCEAEIDEPVRRSW